MERLTDEEFKAMVASNVWHDNLGDLVRTVAECVGNSTPPGLKWHWSRSPGFRAKYIDVRIDMRDGGYIVMASGERISLEQLQRCGLKTDE